MKTEFDRIFLPIITLLVAVFFAILPLFSAAQSQLVIQNPSFDFNPTLAPNSNSPGNAPAPWVPASVYFNCPGTCSVQPSPDAYPNGLPINASDGTEFMGMAAGIPNGSFVTGEAIYQQLVCPMIGGTTYAFNIDCHLATDFFSGQPDPPAFIGVYGINAIPASQEIEDPEILDTALVAIGGQWVTKTLTFTPSQDYDYIIIAPSWSQGGSFPNNTYMYVDNITNIATSCAIQLDLTLTPDTICNGSCSDIEAVVSSTTSPYTITWDNGLPPSIGPHQVCPTTTTTYTAIVVDSTGASDTASVTLEVIDYPVINALASADTICEGSSVQLDASGATTYLWTPGGSTDSSFTVSPTQTTTYQVIGSNWLCTDTAIVEVVVLPPLLYTINGIDPTCYGDADGVVWVEGVSSANYSATWNGVQGDTLSGLTSGTYILELTDLAAGCTVFDTVILADPAPVTVMILGDTIICEGESAQLQAVAGGGVGGYSYMWSNTDTTVTTSVSPLFDATHAVLVSDAVGCTASSSTTIEVHAPPVLDIGGPYSGCAALNVAFQNNTPESLTYNWDFGDGATGTGAEPEHVYVNAGSYDVIVTATSALGCVGVDTLSNWVEVYPVPDIDASVSSTNLNDLDNSVLTLFGSALNSDSCVIDWGDGNISEGCFWDNTDYSYTTPGVYDITVYAYNMYGCMDTATLTVTFEETPVIYIPNAFTPDGDGNNDFFFAKGTNIVDFEMTIWNRWGELIYTTTSMDVGWDGRYKGTDVQQDVYVYKANYSTTNGDFGSATGHVTLLR